MLAITPAGGGGPTTPAPPSSPPTVTITPIFKPMGASKRKDHKPLRNSFKFVSVTAAAAASNESSEPGSGGHGGDSSHTAVVQSEPVDLRVKSRLGSCGDSDGVTSSSRCGH